MLQVTLSFSLNHHCTHKTTSYTWHEVGDPRRSWPDASEGHIPQQFPIVRTAALAWTRNSSRWATAAPPLRRHESCLRPPRHGFRRPLRRWAFLLHHCHRRLCLTGHSNASIHGGWIFLRTACVEGRGRGSNWEGCPVPSTRDGAYSCLSMRSPPIVDISTSFLIRSPSPDRLPSPLYSFQASWFPTQVSNPSIFLLDLLWWRLTLFLVSCSELHGLGQSRISRWVCPSDDLYYVHASPVIDGLGWWTWCDGVCVFLQWSASM
jgi:hypothetical protein